MSGSRGLRRSKSLIVFSDEVLATHRWPAR
jgi:hypothetical protein